MKKTLVSPGGVTIWMGEERDIPGLRRLVRQTLADSGMGQWESMEISVFEGQGQMLVMARPGTERHSWYFRDRRLLEAACRVCQMPESCLYCHNGGYVLVFSGAVPPAVREFGERLSLPPLWEVWADEHGLRLCGESAGEILGRQNLT